MPPKKVNLGHSLYSSESGGRHRSSGSNARKHMAGKCKGMKCADAYHPAGLEDEPVRYTLERCKRACKEGSNLCGPCEKQYGVPGKWHAKVGNTQLHPTSHARDPRFPMSEWNVATMAKGAKKRAKAATRRKSSSQGRQTRASGSPRSNTRRARANRGASPSPSKQEVTNEALAAYLKSQAK